MKLHLFPEDYTVCQPASLPKLTAGDGLWFLSRTDEEISLVCTSRLTPQNCIASEPGWRMLRVEGPLDFSLTGILAGLAKTLADAGVPIFAVSTYNTDYLLIKSEHLLIALQALTAAGHQIIK